MQPRGPTPIPLTSATTTWFTRVAPGLFALLGGTVTALAWLDLLGDASAPLAVKWGITVVWAVGSVAARWLSGHFHHVWLDGDTLVVGDARRGLRVALRDVSSVEETRWQKLKCVKLRLARPTPLGTTIRLIPRGREGWLLPWMTSPVAGMLRERIAALEGRKEGRAALP